MDSSLSQGHGREDPYSQPPRSRANSGVSTTTTEGLFQSLQLVDSPRSIVFGSSRPQSSQSWAPSPSYISPHFSHTAAVLPTSVSQAPSPLPQPFPDDSLNAEWFDLESTSEGAPFLRLEAAEGYPQTASSSPALSSHSASMSAVAISNFDPMFGMGSRSSFPWPGMEGSSGLLGHDLSSYGAPDPSLSPASTSRSMTGSPPRGTLTPEQRELKRQRDLARRDSKAATRLRRAGSASYQSPPTTIAEMAHGAAAGTSSVSMYTTTAAPSQMSLLTEPVASHGGGGGGAMAPPSYMSSYSPPLGTAADHQAAAAAAMFQNPYQQTAYLSDYPTYPAVTTPPLPSHYGRTPSIPISQDPNLMYQHLASQAAPPPPPPQSHSQQQQHHHHQQHQQQMIASGSGGGGGGHDPGSSVRVVQSRPKPQCWEHGCNGRQFSTFSNLLRHQREKSGQAAKAVCPNCGAEFTRTTARNGHLQHDKCKQRRGS